MSTVAWKKVVLIVIENRLENDLYPLDPFSMPNVKSNNREKYIECCISFKFPGKKTLFLDII
jgi:hypothetical protein